MEKQRRIITLPDVAVMVLILAAAVLLALIFALGASDGASLEITSPGETVVFNDDCEYIIESNGYTLTVVYKDGAAWVSESDCPNRDCVNTGRIDRAGQAIVCLPAQVVIELGGGEQYDAVLG